MKLAKRKKDTCPSTGHIVFRLPFYAHATVPIADWLDEKLVVDSSRCKGEGPTAASIYRSKIASFRGHNFGSKIRHF